MTVLVAGRHSYFFGTQAFLLEGDRDMASHWANKHIVPNQAIKWVVGKYVEADNANYNNQYWRLEDLQLKSPTIVHSPMNINHQAHNIVGTFPAAEMMYPTKDQAGDGAHPYVETLGAFWKFYFPEIYTAVEAAFKSGKLYQSMECVSDTITCVGDNGCGETFPYAGPASPTYCAHLRNGGVKQLDDPHFLAGALILPPNQPGWGGASVHELSELIERNVELAESIYNDVSKDMPHLEPLEWEALMAELLMKARTFTPEQRQKMAKSGHAMPDGSFPILNTQDLKNAIQACGRAKDPEAVKAHIKKMAKAMDAMDMIPAGW